jgi:uncharacterized protein YigA (DUF484 family)
MTADDVARFLTSHPSFFDEHADLLAQIEVPNPHGGRAIALSDRQVLALREKVRSLETKLAELIEFGEENDALSERVHRLALAVLRARELDVTIAALVASLRDDFAVPHVALRLFRGAGAGAEFAETTPEVRAYAAALAAPFCGPSQGSEAAGWFTVGAEHIRSMACMALRDGDTTFGLLALGSEDAKRFYPEMGTLYLGRIGDLAGAALARHV